MAAAAGVIAAAESAHKMIIAPSTAMPLNVNRPSAVSRCLCPRGMSNFLMRKLVRQAETFFTAPQQAERRETIRHLLLTMLMCETPIIGHHDLTFVQQRLGCGRPTARSRRSAASKLPRSRSGTIWRSSWLPSLLVRARSAVTAFATRFIRPTMSSDGKLTRSTESASDEDRRRQHAIWPSALQTPPCHHAVQFVSRLGE